LYLGINAAVFCTRSTYSTNLQYLAWVLYLDLVRFDN
jgi:hypothetical protein